MVEFLKKAAEKQPLYSHFKALSFYDCLLGILKHFRCFLGMRDQRVLINNLWKLRRHEMCSRPIKQNSS